MCKFYENEIKEYLVKEDIQVLDTIGKKKNCNFSFRAAGADTIKCLSRGAGAKPHSILAKTIKNTGDKTTQNKVNAFFVDFSDKAKAEDLLKGLVGHWGKEAPFIDGIFLTRMGKKIFEEENLKEENKNNIKYKVIAEKTNFYLELKTSADKNALIDFYDKLPASNEHIRNYLFTRLFFSGDYDMHDLWQSRFTIPSKVDMSVIEEMQKALYLARMKQILALCYPQCKEKIKGLEGETTIRSYAAGKLKELNDEDKYREDYYRIQHGPQYNYIAQMVNDNIRCQNIDDFSNLIDKVSNPDLPVLMYFRKEGTQENGEKNNSIWSVIQTKSDLEKKYALYNVTIKETWENPEKIETHKFFVAKQIIRAYKHHNDIDKDEVKAILVQGNAISDKLKELECYQQLEIVHNKLKAMYTDIEAYRENVKKAVEMVYALL